MIQALWEDTARYKTMHNYDYSPLVAFMSNKHKKINIDIDFWSEPINIGICWFFYTMIAFVILNIGCFFISIFTLGLLFQGSLKPVYDILLDALNMIIDFMGGLDAIIRFLVPVISDIYRPTEDELS